MPHEEEFTANHSLVTTKQISKQTEKPRIEYSASFFVLVFCESYEFIAKDSN